MTFYSQAKFEPLIFLYLWDYSGQSWPNFVSTGTVENHLDFLGSLRVKICKKSFILFDAVIHYFICN